MDKSWERPKKVFRRRSAAVFALCPSAVIISSCPMIMIRDDSISNAPKMYQYSGAHIYIIPTFVHTYVRPWSGIHSLVLVRNRKECRGRARQVAFLCHAFRGHVLIVRYHASEDIWSLNLTLDFLRPSRHTHAGSQHHNMLIHERTLPREGTKPRFLNKPTNCCCASAPSVLACNETTLSPLNNTQNWRFKKPTLTLSVGSGRSLVLGAGVASGRAATHKYEHSPAAVRRMIS